MYKCTAQFCLAAWQEANQRTSVPWFIPPSCPFSVMFQRITPFFHKESIFRSDNVTKPLRVTSEQRAEQLPEFPRSLHIHCRECKASKAVTKKRPIESRALAFWIVSEKRGTFPFVVLKFYLPFPCCQDHLYTWTLICLRGFPREPAVAMGLRIKITQCWVGLLFFWLTELAKRCGMPTTQKILNLSTWRCGFLSER